jgi:hypothetical protein
MLRSRHLTLALCVLCVSAVRLSAAPGKPAPKAKPRAAPKKEKSISGSGFTLRERTGSLDREALEYLGNPRTEAAMRRGLKFLSEDQNPDGSWGDPGRTADVGITGLCALAFMSAGHQPDRGLYGTPLRKATDYLVRHCQRTGFIFDPNATFNRPMYGHGFATLALAELYGMTRRADLREKLESAVGLILRTQNEEGGWRYYPRIADADISVVICQIMALRAAANAGVKVPRETTDKAIAYVKRCANNADGGFSYMPTQPGSGLGRTGAGVLSLIVMGQRDAPEVKRGLEFILTRPPGTRDVQVFYAYYYCTQATYQAGGKYWSFWYPKVSDLLLSTQNGDGSWNDGPGAPYATAMAVLALQVPATLLPIYQK